MAQLRIILNLIQLRHRSVPVNTVVLKSGAHCFLLKDQGLKLPCFALNILGWWLYWVFGFLSMTMCIHC